jgi:hypothetical protein
MNNDFVIFMHPSKLNTEYVLNKGVFLTLKLRVYRRALAKPDTRKTYPQAGDKLWITLYRKNLSTGYPQPYTQGYPQNNFQLLIIHRFIPIRPRNLWKSRISGGFYPHVVHRYLWISY